MITYTKSRELTNIQYIYVRRRVANAERLFRGALRRFEIKLEVMYTLMIGMYLGIMDNCPP